MPATSPDPTGGLGPALAARNRPRLGLTTRPGRRPGLGMLARRTIGFGRSIGRASSGRPRIEYQRAAGGSGAIRPPLAAWFEHADPEPDPVVVRRAPERAATRPAAGTPARPDPDPTAAVVEPFGDRKVDALRRLLRSSGTDGPGRTSAARAPRSTPRPTTPSAPEPTRGPSTPGDPDAVPVPFARRTPSGPGGTLAGPRTGPGQLGRRLRPEAATPTEGAPIPTAAAPTVPTAPRTTPSGPTPSGRAPTPGRASPIRRSASEDVDALRRLVATRHPDRSPGPPGSASSPTSPTSPSSPSSPATRSHLAPPPPATRDTEPQGRRPGHPTTGTPATRSHPAPEHPATSDTESHGREGPGQRGGPGGERVGGGVAVLPRATDPERNLVADRTIGNTGDTGDTGDTMVRRLVDLPSHPLTTSVGSERTPTWAATAEVRPPAAPPDADPRTAPTPQMAPTPAAVGTLPNQMPATRAPGVETAGRPVPGNRMPATVGTPRSPMPAGRAPGVETAGAVRRAVARRTRAQLAPMADLSVRTTLPHTRSDRYRPSTALAATIVGRRTAVAPTTSAGTPVAPTGVTPVRSDPTAETGATATATATETATAGGNSVRPDARAPSTPATGAPTTVGRAPGREPDPDRAGVDTDVTAAGEPLALARPGTMFARRESVDPGHRSVVAPGPGALQRAIAPTAASDRPAAPVPAPGPAPTAAPARRGDGLAQRFMTELTRATPTTPPAPLPRRFTPMAEAITGRRQVLISTDDSSRRALRSVGKVAATVDDVIHLAAPPVRPDARTTEVIAHELTHVAHPSPEPRFFDDDDRGPEERTAEQIGRIMARAPLAPNAPAARRSPSARPTTRTAEPTIRRSPARAATRPGTVTADEMAARVTGGRSGSGVRRSSPSSGSGKIRRFLDTGSSNWMNFADEDDSYPDDEDDADDEGDAGRGSGSARRGARSGAKRAATAGAASAGLGFDEDLADDLADLLNSNEGIAWFRQQLVDHLDVVFRGLEDHVIVELERRGGRGWAGL